MASVRTQLEATCQIDKLDRCIGADGKYRPVTMAKGGAEYEPNSDSGSRPHDPDLRVHYNPKTPPPVLRTPEDRKTRIQATTLIHGDCREVLKTIASQSVDAIITDPIYPEVSREYGRITEDEWHSLMRLVVSESHRILTPKGSAVFILQPTLQREVVAGRLLLHGDRYLRHRSRPRAILTYFSSLSIPR